MISHDVQTALAYFVRMGWTPAQAAGIVANLEAESGLNPAAVGDGGQAYGIAQWHPDRQEHFRTAIGKDIRGSTLAEQLEFVHVELTTSEKAAGGALLATTTPAAAAEVVSRRYERPADADGEARRRAARAESLFAEAPGPVGATQPAPAVPDSRQPAPSAPTGGPMGAVLGILSVLGPVLQGVLPVLEPLIGGKKDHAAMEALGTALNVVVEKTQGAGTPTTMATVANAIEQMQNDPAVKKTVTEAVVTHPDIIGLLEVGGGVASAREFGVKVASGEKPFWFNPTFWITIALLPVVYMIVFAVLFMVGPADPKAAWEAARPWYAQLGFDPTTRSGLTNLIAGMVIGGIVGVWFGTSYGSQRKTELAAAGEQAK